MEQRFFIKRPKILAKHSSQLGLLRPSRHRLEALRNFWMSLGPSPHLSTNATPAVHRAGRAPHLGDSARRAHAHPSTARPRPSSSLPPTVARPTTTPNKTVPDNPTRPLQARRTSWLGCSPAPAAAASSASGAPSPRPPPRALPAHPARTASHSPPRGASRQVAGWTPAERPEDASQPPPPLRRWPLIFCAAPAAYFGGKEVARTFSHKSCTKCAAPLLVGRGPQPRRGSPSLAALRRRPPPPHPSAPRRLGLGRLRGGRAWSHFRPRSPRQVRLHHRPQRRDRQGAAARAGDQPRERAAQHAVRVDEQHWEEGLGARASGRAGVGVGACAVELLRWEYRGWPKI